MRALLTITTILGLLVPAVANTKAFDDDRTAYEESIVKINEDSRGRYAVRPVPERLEG
jgi:hypothetical protein